MRRIKKASRSIEKGITPEYVAADRGLQITTSTTTRRRRCLVVNTNEIDFVNRPADFDDLVAQIQKAREGCSVLRSCWLTPRLRGADWGLGDWGTGSKRPIPPVAHVPHVPQSETGVTGVQ
jgi:hypothetical protein